MAKFDFIALAQAQAAAQQAYDAAAKAAKHYEKHLIATEKLVVVKQADRETAHKALEAAKAAIAAAQKQVA